MPLYQYHCESCDHEEEEFQHMREEPFKVCPVCDCPTYHRVPTRVHTDRVEFHKPIEMFSIAMEDPAEIREFQRQCPDVQVSADPRDELYGVPIAASRQQKKQALDAAGFEER